MLVEIMVGVAVDSTSKSVGDLNGFVGIGPEVGVVVDSMGEWVGNVAGSVCVGLGVGVAVGVIIGTATTIWEVVTGRGLGGRVGTSVGSGVQATSALKMQTSMKKRGWILKSMGRILT